MSSSGERRFRRKIRAVEEAAKRMRREPTPAEAALWDALRDRRLAGLKFRRQYALDRFVLDFYCPAARLVVEADGPVHDEQMERDAERSAWPEASGLRVIRFRNEEILSDLPRVLGQIRQSARDSPSPACGRGTGEERRGEPG